MRIVEQSQDVKTRIQALTILFGCYGQADNANRIAIYASLLKDFSAKTITLATQKMMLENKFLPSVAEIAEACRSLAATASGKKEVPDWNEAWAEIEKAMYRTPWGKLPQFSHPAITQAVNNYGWKSIHECMADDFHTMQAQLRRMYDESAKRYVENLRNQHILGNEPALAQGKTLGILGVSANE